MVRRRARPATGGLVPPDDPEGEVGLEGFLLGSEGRTTLVDAGDFELVVARVVGVSISAEQTLVATWAGGRDVVVAGLRPRRL